MADRQQIYSRTCPHCGKRFNPARKNQIYCSTICRRRAEVARRGKGKAA